MDRRIFLAALILLAACEKTEEKANELSAEEVAAQLAALEIEPGLWESTTQIVSVSAPLPQEALQQMLGPRSSIRNCITPEQAERPSANFLAAQRNADCTYQAFRIRDGRLSGRMSCTGGDLPGETVTVMNGAYGPDAYDLIMDMETAALAGLPPMKIKARTQGKRLGDCPES